MARATSLRRAGSGKLSSSKSKTGDPACSSAMSAWVMGRAKGLVPPGVFAILGKCRAKARMMRGAQLQRAAGNNLRAQALEARAARGLGVGDRKAKAKELLASRSAKQAEKAQRLKDLDGMSMAIGMSSPSGRQSKRSKDAASKRLSEHLFGPNGLEAPKGPSIPEHERLRHQAAELRDLAARGMKPRAHVKEAKRLEEQAARMEAGDKLSDFSGRMKKQAEALRNIEKAGGEKGAAAGRVATQLEQLANKRKATAAGRGTAERMAQARKLLEQRKAKAAAASKPAPGGWSLAQASEKGKAAFKTENSGGKTGFMFDMKKGDLKGQTSIFDKVGTVHTSEKAGPSAAQLSRAVPKVGGGSPQAILAHAQEQLAKRSKLAEKFRGLRASRLEHTSPDTHGKTGGTYEFSTDKIHFDPDRFQYKLGAQGKHGVTSALGDVKKWDPELAGVVSVWKDPANGKTFVVNGHHRLDLAKKLGVKNVTAKYLDAANAKEARGKGAMVNIAEGRGSAVDAAKFFRDTKLTHEQASAKGISLREHTAAQGLAMTGLHDRAFDRVVKGDLSPTRAAIIGGASLSDDAQDQLLKLLDKPSNRKLTDGTVKNMVDSAKAASSVKKTTRDLFGESEEEQSLFIQRAKLEDSLKRQLGADQRLFGLVSKSKAAQKLAERGRSSIDVATTGEVGKEAADTLHVFDQLKHRHPAISRVLNNGSERLASGEDKATVERDVRKQITRKIKDFIAGRDVFED